MARLIGSPTSLRRPKAPITPGTDNARRTARLDIAKLSFGRKAARRLALARSELGLYTTGFILGTVAGLSRQDGVNSWPLKRKPSWLE